MGAVALMFAGAQAVGQYSQARSNAKLLRVEGDYMRALGERNAAMAELQAEDAINRGKRAAERVQEEGDQLIGSQRAALAANGIDVNDSGTASAIQEDTAAITARDKLVIENNAWREAWGYRVDALNATSQGAIAQAGSRAKAADTLLTGGLQAANTLASGLGSYSRTRTSTTDVNVRRPTGTVSAGRSLMTFGGYV